MKLEGDNVTLLTLKESNKASTVDKKVSVHEYERNYCNIKLSLSDGGRVVKTLDSNVRGAGSIPTNCFLGMVFTKRIPPGIFPP